LLLLLVEVAVSLRERLRALFRKVARRADCAASRGETPPPRPRDVAAKGLVDARQAFLGGNPGRADELAAGALRLLAETARDEGDAEPLRARRAALESALLAVRGGAAAQAGRLEDARTLFEESRARAVASQSPTARVAAALNLIDVSTRRGSHDANDPLLDEAARAAAGGSYEDVLGKLVLERGIAATREGALGDAIALFDRAIALRPQWPFPWYQRAWARFLSGDASGALDDYRECARRRAPFYTVLREVRCLEDVAAGRLALEAYRSYCVAREHVRSKPAAVDESAGRLLGRHPDFAPAHLLRAEARLALGDAEGARAAARETLRHDPDPDTAASALFLEWNLARVAADGEARAEAEERLLGPYGEQPAAEIVRRLRAGGVRDVVMRWTWALDGTFRLDEGPPPRAGDGSPGARQGGGGDV
jgi:tetratricopeptide (TPR) repeat protein